MTSRRRMVTGTWLGLLIALGSSAPLPLLAQSQQAPSDPAIVSLPTELATVLRNYEAAWGDADAVALADLFTTDGFVMRPGQPPAHGREAILAAYANSGGPLSLRAYHYQVDGDVGFIIGGYAITPTMPTVGKFVLALQRSPSGDWLIAADIDNGN